MANPELIYREKEYENFMNLKEEALGMALSEAKCALGVVVVGGGLATVVDPGAKTFVLAS